MTTIDSHTVWTLLGVAGMFPYMFWSTAWLIAKFSRIFGFDSPPWATWRHEVYPFVLPGLLADYAAAEPKNWQANGAFILCVVFWWTGGRDDNDDDDRWRRRKAKLTERIQRLGGRLVVTEVRA